jgi:hypothetical protein
MLSTVDLGRGGPWPGKDTIRLLLGLAELKDPELAKQAGLVCLSFFGWSYS